MHQILQDSALNIGLYNSLYYLTTRDHGLYAVLQAVLTVLTVVSCSNNFITKLGSGRWAMAAPQKLCGPRTPYHVLRILNTVVATEM